MDTAAGWFAGDRSHHVTEILGIAVRAKIGATDLERHPAHYQLMLVDVTLFRHGGSLAGARLADCLDYDPIYRHVMEWERRPHTDLLETLAEDLLEACFRDPSVEAARVRLRKPQVYHNVEDVGITLYRRREDQPAAG